MSPLLRHDALLSHAARSRRTRRHPEPPREVTAIRCYLNGPTIPHGEGGTVKLIRSHGGKKKPVAYRTIPVRRAHALGSSQCGVQIPEPASPVTAQPFREVTVSVRPAAAGEGGLSLSPVPVRAAARLARGSRRPLRRSCGLSGARDAARQAARTPPSPACEDALRLGQSRKESTCLCGLRTGHRQREGVRSEWRGDRAFAIVFDPHDALRPARRAADCSPGRQP